MFHYDGSLRKYQALLLPSAFCPLVAVPVARQAVLGDSSTASMPVGCVLLTVWPSRNMQKHSIAPSLQVWVSTTELSQCRKLTSLYRSTYIDVITRRV